MSGAELREAAILGALVERVQAKGLFCGETLLQKSAFFFKEVFSVDLDLNFQIYYYGPFSFELRKKLSSMQADDIVRLVPHQLGASYEVGPRFDRLREKFPKTLAKAEKAISFATEELAPLTVKKLEALATALLVTRQNKEANLEKRIKLLGALKPHIDTPEATRSIEQIDEWIRAYSTP
jgi:uncharacterized protein YwgA